MNIKEYQGNDIRKLIKKIKSELGNDAIILDTICPSRKKGLIRMFRKTKFVIVAAKNSKYMSRPKIMPPPLQNNKLTSITPSTIPISKVNKGLKKYEDASCDISAPTPTPKSHSNTTDLEKQLNEIKTILSQLEQNVKYSDISSLPKDLLNAYHNLVNNSVSEKLGKMIISGIHSKMPQHSNNPKLIKEAIRLTINKLVKVENPLSIIKKSPNIILFVGPTGVGKTTTIAKLASKLVLQRKSVGLITIDTYRIAAGEQLKRTAEIMRIPVKIIDYEKPQEIKQAINDYKDMDYILVDTAGRSQLDTTKMNELHNTINFLNPDKIELVLSITTEKNTMLNQIELFSSINVDHLILTKLDESIKYGSILDILSTTKKPVSFITYGQIIPDDVEIAKLPKLSSLILGEI